MKYIFFGTPKFAAIVLEKLINAGYIPEAVICNPDEPIGRKQILTPPPTKILARKYGINILQPEILANYKLQITNHKPDLAIVAAYGKILPKEILEIPRLRAPFAEVASATKAEQGFGGQAKHGFINVHGSLLPKYRGASPIQAAILNGDKETGITIMKIDEEMDHGPLLGKSEIRISKSETFESLSQKLAISGAELLVKTIPDYISGKIKPIEQDHSKATYTEIIKREDGKIDWSKSAEEIERMTRAFYPWPTAWAIWNNKILKIFEVEIIEKDFTKSAIADFVKWPVGRVFLYKNIFAIKCNECALVTKKLQLEGGKILSAKEFLNGHGDFIGSVLK